MLRDVIGLVTGLATPAMNGVWATSAVVNVDAVREALDSIIDAEFPYCLQFLIRIAGWRRWLWNWAWSARLTCR